VANSQIRSEEIIMKEIEELEQDIKNKIKLIDNVIKKIKTKENNKQNLITYRSNSEGGSASCRSMSNAEFATFLGEGLADDFYGPNFGIYFAIAAGFVATVAGFSKTRCKCDRCRQVGVQEINEGFYDALENLKNNNNIRVSEEIENDKTLRETVQQVQVMINEIKADAVEMMKLEKELYDIVGPQQNQRTIRRRNFSKMEIGQDINCNGVAFAFALGSALESVSEAETLVDENEAESAASSGALLGTAVVFGFDILFCECKRTEKIFCSC